MNVMEEIKENVHICHEKGHEGHRSIEEGCFIETHNLRNTFRVMASEAVQYQDEALSSPAS